MHGRDVEEIEEINEEDDERDDAEEPSFIVYANEGEAFANEDDETAALAWRLSLPTSLQSARALWTPQEARQQLLLHHAAYRRLLHETIGGTLSEESRRFSGEHVGHTNSLLGYAPYWGAGVRVSASDELGRYVHPRPSCPIDLLCWDLHAFVTSEHKKRLWEELSPDERFHRRKVVLEDFYTFVTEGKEKRLHECPTPCGRFFLSAPMQKFCSEACRARSLAARRRTPAGRKINAAIQQRHRDGANRATRLEVGRIIKRLQREEGEKIPKGAVLDRINARKAAGESKMTVRRLRFLQAWEKSQPFTHRVMDQIDWEAD